MRWPDDKQQIKATYESKGFVVLREFFNSQEVATIQENLDRYIAEVVPQLPKMDAFYQEKGNVSTIKMLSRMQHHDPYFHALLFAGSVRALAEHLWGTKALGQDMTYFGKPAAIGDPTPPHQDGYYFHLEPCEATTMWLALEDVDEENGCLRYVTGSHRRGMRPHARTETLGFSQGITDYGCTEDLENEVAVTAGPGDLIAHDGLTIHRADGNDSPTRSRRAMGFVFYSDRAQVDEAAKEAYQRLLKGEWAEQGKI